MNRTAAALIARSISHMEISHAAWSDELDAALDYECNFSLTAGNTIEFWGGGDVGPEWRVHLAIAVAS